MPPQQVHIHVLAHITEFVESSREPFCYLPVRIRVQARVDEVRRTDFRKVQPGQRDGADHIIIGFPGFFLTKLNIKIIVIIGTDSYRFHFRISPDRFIGSPVTDVYFKIKIQHILPIQVIVPDTEPCSLPGLITLQIYVIVGLHRVII